MTAAGITGNPAAVRKPEPLPDIFPGLMPAHLAAMVKGFSYFQD